MSTDRISRRFALRARTASAHAALDAMIGEWGDRHDYRRYLGGIAAFRLPLEAALEGRIPARLLAAWRPDGVSAALRADCDDLGIAVPTMDNSDFDALEDESAVVGACYVLEGSSIGARLLARRAATLGMTAECGARHLAQQAALSWSGFLEALEAAPGLNLDAAAAGANATFDLARRAFSERVDAGA